MRSYLLLILAVITLLPACVGCANLAQVQAADTEGDAAALAALAEQSASESTAPRVSLEKHLPAVQPAPQPTAACRCAACDCAPCECQSKSQPIAAPIVRTAMAPRVVCDGNSCRVVNDAGACQVGGACGAGACGSGACGARGPVRAVIGAPVRIVGRVGRAWNHFRPVRRVLRGAGCLFGRCR